MAAKKKDKYKHMTKGLENLQGSLSNSLFGTIRKVEYSTVFYISEWEVSNWGSCLSSITKYYHKNFVLSLIRSKMLWFYTYHWKIKKVLSLLHCQKLRTSSTDYREKIYIKRMIHYSEIRIWYEIWSFFKEPSSKLRK